MPIPNLAETTREQTALVEARIERDRKAREDAVARRDAQRATVAAAPPETVAPESPAAPEVPEYSEPVGTEQQAPSLGKKLVRAASLLTTSPYDPASGTLNYGLRSGLPGFLTELYEELTGNPSSKNPLYRPTIDTVARGVQDLYSARGEQVGIEEANDRVRYDAARTLGATEEEARNINYGTPRAQTEMMVAWGADLLERNNAAGRDPADTMWLTEGEGPESPWETLDLTQSPDGVYIDEGAYFRRHYSSQYDRLVRENPAMPDSARRAQAEASARETMMRFKAGTGLAIPFVIDDPEGHYAWVKSAPWMFRPFLAMATPSQQFVHQRSGTRRVFKHNGVLDWMGRISMTTLLSASVMAEADSVHGASESIGAATHRLARYSTGFLGQLGLHLLSPDEGVDSISVYDFANSDRVQKYLMDGGDAFDATIPVGLAVKRQLGNPEWGDRDDSWNEAAWLGVPAVFMGIMVEPDIFGPVVGMAGGAIRGGLKGLVATRMTKLATFMDNVPSRLGSAEDMATVTARLTDGGALEATPTVLARLAEEDGMARALERMAGDDGVPPTLESLVASEGLPGVLARLKAEKQRVGVKALLADLRATTALGPTASHIFEFDVLAKTNGNGGLAATVNDMIYASDVAKSAVMALDLELAAARGTAEAEGIALQRVYAEQFAALAEREALRLRVQAAEFTTIRIGGAASGVTEATVKAELATIDARLKELMSAPEIATIRRTADAADKQVAKYERQADRLQTNAARLPSMSSGQREAYRAIANAPQWAAPPPGTHKRVLNNLVRKGLIEMDDAGKVRPVALTPWRVSPQFTTAMDNLGIAQKQALRLRDTLEDTIRKALGASSQERARLMQQGAKLLEQARALDAVKQAKKLRAALNVRDRMIARMQKGKWAKADIRSAKATTKYAKMYTQVQANAGKIDMAALYKEAFARTSKEWGQSLRSFVKMMDEPLDTQPHRGLLKAAFKGRQDGKVGIDIAELNRLVSKTFDEGVLEEAASRAGQGGSNQMRYLFEVMDSATGGAIPFPGRAMEAPKAISWRTPKQIQLLQEGLEQVDIVRKQMKVGPAKQADLLMRTYLNDPGAPLNENLISRGLRQMTRWVYGSLDGFAVDKQRMGNFSEFIYQTYRGASDKAERARHEIGRLTDASVFREPGMLLANLDAWMTTTGAINIPNAARLPGVLESTLFNTSSSLAPWDRLVLYTLEMKRAKRKLGDNKALEALARAALPEGTSLPQDIKSDLLGIAYRALTETGGFQGAVGRTPEAFLARYKQMAATQIQRSTGGMDRALPSHPGTRAEVIDKGLRSLESLKFDFEYRNLRVMRIFAGAAAHASVMRQATKEVTAGLAGGLSVEEARALAKWVDGLTPGAHDLDAWHSVMQKLGITFFQREPEVVSGIQQMSKAARSLDALEILDRTAGLQGLKGAGELGPASRYGYIPTAMATALEGSVADLIKTLDARSSKESANGIVGDAFRTYIQLWKIGKVTGILIPRPKYWTNMLIGDWGQMMVERGIVAATRVSFQAVPALLPWGRHISDAAAEMSMKFKGKPVLGGLMNALINPHIGRIFSGKAGHLETAAGDFYTYDRARDFLVRDGVMDNIVSEELLRSWDEIGWDKLGILSKVGKKIGVDGSWQKALADHARLAQQRQRALLYLDVLQQGGTRAEATKAVRDALYDWKHGIGAWDSAAWAALLPFWRFWKLAMRQAMRGAIEPMTRPEATIRALDGQGAISQTIKQARIAQGIPYWSTMQDPDGDYDQTQEYFNIASLFTTNQGWASESAVVLSAWDKADRDQYYAATGREAQGSMTVLPPLTSIDTMGPLLTTAFWMAGGAVAAVHPDVSMPEDPAGVMLEILGVWKDLVGGPVPEMLELASQGPDGAGRTRSASQGAIAKWELVRGVTGVNLGLATANADGTGGTEMSTMLRAFDALVPAIGGELTDIFSSVSNNPQYEDEFMNHYFVAVKHLLGIREYPQDVETQVGRSNARVSAGMSRAVDLTERTNEYTRIQDGEK
jgi:hypothetical protein